MTSLTYGRRLKVSDILHVIRGDTKKLARVHQLLAADRELTKAKAIMNMDELPVKKVSNDMQTDDANAAENEQQEKKRLIQFGDERGYYDDDDDEE